MLTRFSVVYLFLVAPGCFAESNGIRNPFQWIEKASYKEPIEIVRPHRKEVKPKPVSSPCLWKVQGISMGEKGPRALLLHEQRAIVAQQNDALDKDWTVEKISPHGVVLRHQNGEKRELAL